jgi:3-phosphoshikimate 1-carboxyvinyltransferase
MRVQIKPHQRITGHIHIPSSKSYSQRAIVLAMVCPGKSTLVNIGKSADEQAVLAIAKEISKTVSEEGNNTHITGIKAIDIPSKTYSMGESGLATRMLTPILANANSTIHITGKGSLVTRPMTIFHTLFDTLQTTFESQNGTLPFVINGPILPSTLSIDGGLSSQFITGFLYGLVVNEKLTNQELKINNLKSRPYFDLSLAVLEKFGISLTLKPDDSIQFNGPYTLKPNTIQIEGDWSSASFFIVAAAIGGEIRISNLNNTSKQADIAVLDAVQRFGAKVRWEENDLIVTQDKNYAFEFDATDCPDLFPPLAALAVFGDKPSRIKGISRLTHKESNRALTIQTEFEKLGIQVENNEDDDVMLVYPKKTPNGGTIDSNNDHRIAMAGAILALKASDPVTINNAEAVSKSFVEFYDTLNGLGVQLVSF